MSNFLTAFTIFSLPFSIFTIICLGVEIFAFMLLGVCWTSWMCRLVFFNKFGKFGEKTVIFKMYCISNWNTVYPLKGCIHMQPFFRPLTTTIILSVYEFYYSLHSISGMFALLVWFILLHIVFSRFIHIYLMIEFPRICVFLSIEMRYSQFLSIKTFFPSILNFIFTFLLCYFLIITYLVLYIAICLISKK